MSPSPQSQVRTRMFARVVGPFLATVTATAAVRASDMRTLLSEFEENPLWAWVAGAFILLFGLVAIALHQQWQGAAAIIVSVVGWLVALKGLFLMVFPHTLISVANTAIDATGWWRAGFVVFALIGLYLTYVGWMPAQSQPAREAAGSTRDLPRAA